MPLDRARGESSHAPVDHANGRRGRLFAGETQRAAMRLGGVWLFITLAFGILAAPLAGDTQQAGKVPRVGVLTTAISPTTELFRELLRQGCVS